MAQVNHLFSFSHRNPLFISPIEPISSRALERPIFMEEQVKSKQRVADHGEVFTAEREVNAMLDLVKNETERIDSRFLEPACGKVIF